MHRLAYNGDVVRQLPIRAYGQGCPNARSAPCDPRQKRRTWHDRTRCRAPGHSMRSRRVSVVAYRASRCDIASRCASPDRARASSLTMRVGMRFARLSTSDALDRTPDGKTANSPRTRRVALKMGRLPYVDAHRRTGRKYSQLAAARRALKTAHFERNDITIICETVH